MSDYKDNRKFTALLRRASRLAAETADVASELTTAFEQRYGTTYSDVDCDWLIDELDIIGSDTPKITAKEADSWMKGAGAPLLEGGAG